MTWEANGFGSKTPSRPQSIYRYNVHTKTSISQYGDITYSKHSSDSQLSQIPNQNFIVMLDGELNNKARDTYIETLAVEKELSLESVIFLFTLNPFLSSTNTSAILPSLTN
jgi:hypothetical protein